MEDNAPFLYDNDGSPTHWGREYFRRASKGRNGPKEADKWWHEVLRKHREEQARKGYADKNEDES